MLKMIRMPHNAGLVLILLLVGGIGCMCSWLLRLALLSWMLHGCCQIERPGEPAANAAAEPGLHEMLVVYGSKINHHTAFNIIKIGGEIIT